MKIKSVKTTCHQVSIPDALTNLTIHKNVVFINIETDEGITGQCVLSGSPNDCDYVNKKLTPLLIGKNPLENEKIWYDILRSTRSRFPYKGASIVDCALWDIKGKYFGQPIWRLIGGARKKIPVYITLGSGNPIYNYSLDQFAEWSKDLVKDGWNAIKIALSRGWKFDRGSHAKIKTENENVTLVRVVREAIGDNVKLIVDSNTENSLIQAVRLAKLIEPYDITWFEEPVWGNDPHLLSQMKLHTSVPIAAGQTTEGKWLFRDLITIGNVDVVQPDVQNVGGFTEGVKVAHMAQAFNKQFATHGVPNINCQLVAGLENGWFTEWHFTSWKSEEKIFKNSLVPKNGYIIMLDRPGLGLTPNEEYLAENMIE